MPVGLISYIIALAILSRSPLDTGIHYHTQRFPAIAASLRKEMHWLGEQHVKRCCFGVEGDSIEAFGRPRPSAMFTWESREWRGAYKERACACVPFVTELQFGELRCGKGGLSRLSSAGAASP